MKEKSYISANFDAKEALSNVGLGEKEAEVRQGRQHTPSVISTGTLQPQACSPLGEVRAGGQWIFSFFRFSSLP